MDLAKLEEQLNNLRIQMHKLETVETEKIRQKRILADMGDDFRENEGAKMVMEDHQFLHLRTADLRREMLEVKKKIIAARKRAG
jgi:non-homologous end joining protein Ku